MYTFADRLFLNTRKFKQQQLMKKVLWMIFMTFMVLNVNAQKPISSDEVITSNIQYKNGKDTYIKERCKLL